MKLIVQIPCYNEAETLAEVICAIPRDIDGVETVEILLVDDGSTDNTRQIAEQADVDHYVHIPVNRGLAFAFRTGFEKCCELGADIVVNIDGDGQYDAADIPDLISPILAQQADVVIGDRDAPRLKHFSLFKRGMQRLGSAVVSFLAKINVPDATSGFRAYSRNALFKLTIETNFSHSLETLVQAAWKGLEVCSIPVQAHHTIRQSRLSSSSGDFILRSILTLMQVVTYYRPLSLYWSIGGVFFLWGSLPIIRFLWFFANGDGNGHIQSLVLGGTLIVIGMVCFLFGLQSAQINSNRRLLGEINTRLKQQEFDKKN